MPLAATVPSSDVPDRPWLRGFYDVELSGFELQLKVRAALLLLIAIYFFFSAALERALVYALFCGAMVLLGWIVGRVVAGMGARLWQTVAAGLILLDVAALSAVLAFPALVLDHPWPPQMALRFSSFLYLPLYVMGSALTTSPLLVLWTGVAAAGAWSVCVWWIFSQPGTITIGTARVIDTDLPVGEQLRLWLDPQFVSLVAYETQTLVLLLGSAVLALGVWRARRTLLERVRIAEERRNLSRFVPANLADDLAAGPALEAVRRQSVAVMFVDVVGYTALSERLAPEAALAALGEFRACVTRAVLDHRGTVDKFIGDGVMATFGMGQAAAPDYAAQALRCALAVDRAIGKWNAERERSGQEPVEAKIGLHCGEALVGTIGTEERLEHTVIGDVVNVASRLEQLTREHRTRVLVGEPVFAEAARHGAAPDVIDRFGPPRPIEIRGRAGAIEGRALLQS